MKKAILFIGGICCLLALFAGCRDEEATFGLSDEEVEEPVNAVFRLNIALDEGFRSRADRVETDSTPGHRWERAVHKLHLFAVPVSHALGGESLELWERAIWRSVPVGEGEREVEVSMVLNTSGDTRVYVGANLSDAQAEAFVEFREYAVQGEKYFQAINEFAPFITKDETANRRTMDVAMFCREAVTVNVGEIKEGAEQKQGAEEGNVVVEVGTVHLKRMVAKVLVTCDTTEILPAGGVPGVGYLPLRNELNQQAVVGRENSGEQGWIRQENVFYFVNNMPRRTKFVQQYDEQGELLPHYNLRGMIENASLVDKWIPLTFNDAKVKGHFIHYDMHELYRRSGSFQRSAVWRQEEYDKLVGQNDNDRGAYSRERVGMYALENLFEIKDDDFTVDELARLLEYRALPVFTHVSIAVKLTPRYIYVTKEEWNGTDGAEAMKGRTLEVEGETKTLEELTDEVKVILPDGDQGRLLCLRCANEAVAHDILTFSLKRKGRLLPEGEEYVPGDGAKYPKETYFAYHLADDVGGGIAFCSYGTAVSFVEAGSGEPGDNTMVDKTMVPYTQGWGYYYTYINNRENAPIAETWQLKDAVVERNCYYVLRVASIGSMGASVTDPNYMQVHTLRAEWQDGGSGDITLD